MPNNIRLSPGGIIPRDMTQRQWDSYTANAKADYIKSGQTDYDTGIGYFLGDHNGTPKLSIGNSAGNKITWNGSVLAITGTVTATTGTIGGWTLAATYLESGSGANTVRLDSAGVNPAISIGSATPASAPFRVTQAGALTATSATITGNVDLTNTTQTFTPTWAGFSADPSGSLSYIDLGALVFLWNDSGSDMLGTSNSVLMTISGLPAGIRPGNDVIVSTNVIDAAGSGGVHPGTVAVTTGGSLIFRQYLNSISTALDPSDFTNSGSKGLPAGWLISYAT